MAEQGSTQGTIKAGRPKPERAWHSQTQKEQSKTELMRNPGEQPRQKQNTGTAEHKQCRQKAAKARRNHRAAKRESEAAQT